METPTSPGGEPGGGDDVYTPPATLAGPITSGIKWKVVSQVLREGTRLAIGILLARLLTPDEWGVASLAMVAAAFLTMLADVGLPVALVQRARIDEADRSTLFWTALVFGVSFTVVGIATSGLVADLFHEPEVQPLFATLSIGFTIASLEKVPGALLARGLAFRALELRQIVATMSGAIVAVVLALAGAGAWAIIGNSLATTTVSCALLWFVTPWRPHFIFAWSSFRNLTGFGGMLLASQLVTYVQMNADRILIGRFLGTGPVGNYSFAYQLMFTPIGNIAYPLQMVLFPVLSTIQEDVARLHSAWLRSMRLAVAVMAPAFLTLFVVAPDLVPTVFGSRWNDAIPVLQLLCLAGVAYSMNTQNGILLAVQDKVGTLFRLTLGVTAVVVSAVAIGLDWGIVGVAAGLASAYWLLVIPQLWVTTRATGIGFRRTLLAATTPLPFVAVATVAALGLRQGLIELGVPAGVRVVLVAPVLLALYAGLAYLGSASLRFEVKVVVGRIRARRSRRALERTPAETPTYR
jgi:O-antigen/teichoic acid export membrane protein